MGHAFQQTLMDALTRYHRMRGFNTLWLPGTDHAGIATQIVVERQLEAQGKIAPRPRPREVRRARLGVEAGVGLDDHAARCAASAPRPTGTRERTSRWTRDCRAPCVETFVRLYEEGLIYRGKRLVNWDPVLRTAVSDLEVDSEEEHGTIWQIRYPLADGSGVDRRRDDAARDDARRRRGRGASGRRALPRIWSASSVDAAAHRPRRSRSSPTTTSTASSAPACVKITPAHDFNDYAVGQRHGLPLIAIFDARREDQRQRAGEVPRPGPLRRAQGGARRPRGAGPARVGEAAQA